MENLRDYEGEKRRERRREEILNRQTAIRRQTVFSDLMFYLDQHPDARKQLREMLESDPGMLE